MSLELQGDCDAVFDRTIAGAMSRELHKTAQPLTILQGLLEFMLTRVSTGDECRKFLARVGEEAPGLAGCEECRCFLKLAGEELPRLTNCFNDVRKLAGLQRPARDIKNFSLATLVRDVVNNLKGDLDIAGITVVFDVGTSDDMFSGLVNVSHSRVFSAVRLVLTAVSDCLDAGDQIKISFETDGANAVLRFRPSRHSQPAAISERDVLLGALPAQLEFAQLLFASAGGELRLNESPDVVVMTLPIVAPQLAVQDQPAKAMHV